MCGEPLSANRCICGWKSKEYKSKEIQKASSWKEFDTIEYKRSSVVETAEYHLANLKKILSGVG